MEKGEAGATVTKLGAIKIKTSIHKLNPTITIHDPEDYSYPLSKAYITKSGDICLKNIDEDNIFRYLNHEFVHCILNFIGEENANQKYNNVAGYVDWIHCDKNLDGENVWRILNETTLTCPKCGAIVKRVTWDMNIFSCIKCNFLSDKDTYEEWVKFYSNKSLQETLHKYDNLTKDEIRGFLINGIKKEKNPLMKNILKYLSKEMEKDER